MEAFKQKSRWKLYLAIAAIALMLLSAIYTNYLANQLSEGERKKAELYALAVTAIGKSSSTEDELITESQIIENSKVPVIAVDETGKISGSNNFPEGANLEKELEKIKASGREPLEGFGYARYIYYKHTRLLSLLQYFPLIQLFVFLGFAGIGYLAFSAARKSEQNRVWVGMAKETAHQLGTPISAIIAWLEHLKLKNPDPDTQEIVSELENDVERLNLIAERFSKIGSAPTLQKTNLVQELHKCKVYMEKRAPRKIQFDFPNLDSDPVYAQINPPLFDWVIENLLRNSLDAMDAIGSIEVSLSEIDGFINIDITDSGKGIPGNNVKNVFNPGFTTKTRGWGLGLSLAKRIIESYHSGKIFVKSSILNEGTTFSIKLPKA